MELWIFVIISLILLYVILEIIYNEIELIKMVALIFAFFFSGYSVISGIFFLLDKFSFYNVLIVQIIVELFVIGVNRKRISKMKIVFEKKDTVLLIVLGILFCLTSEKFELYGTGQDQGLYQVEAIELYMGNYEVQHDFEEYGILENEEDRQAYKEMVHKVITGYYPLKGRDWPTVNEEEILSDVSGMYHGVQTFPAMLALMGKLIGLENMVQVQTVFYLCTISLFYYFTQKLNSSRILKILMTVLVGISPLILWLSKAFYTEMFLTMLISLYLCLLVEKEHKALIAIPWIAFLFVHVSGVIYLPVFILINLLSYLKDRNKEWIYANVLSAVGLYIGYLSMSVIAPQYFFDNCARLYYGNLITKYNFMNWILLIAILIIVISCLLLILSGNIKEKINSLAKKIIFSNVVPILIFLAIIFWIYYGIKMGYLSEQGSGLTWYYGNGLEVFTHLTIYAFSMATGYFLIPFIIYKMIRNWKGLMENEFGWELGLLFIYLVIIQSILFRKEIQYYYYYSRYLALYIPIICAIGILCLSSWKKKWIVGFAVLSFIPIVIFDKSVIENKDDTIWEWEVLFDLENAIEDNSAIIMEKELQKSMGTQVRALTNCSIFPVFDDVNEQIELLQKNYDYVYYLSGDENAGISNEDEINEDRLQIVYKDSYICSNNGVIKEWHFPISVKKTEEQIALYEIDQIVTIGISENRIGVKNGSKLDEYIQSSGVGGIVAFGPYISLSQGIYKLRIPIEILKYTDETIGSFKCYNEYGKNSIVESIALSDCLKENEKGTYIEVEFTLYETQEKLEFIISAKEGSIFRIFSYDITKLSSEPGEKDNGINIDILSNKIGTIKGLKQNDYIESKGEKGLVMFGPYISLEKGFYSLEIPIDILDYVDGKIGYFYSYNDSGKNILIEKVPIGEYLKEDENRTYLKYFFELKEDQENIEFVVQAIEGSVFRIHSYKITPLE